MENTSLRREEKGVSVVLGAILLLAIAVVAIPPIYNHYIKTSMTSNESSHMEDVRKQFLELQSKASWINGPGEGGKVDIPMNAGSVFLSPGKSPLGTLRILPGRDIEAGLGSSENITIAPGSISFMGHNIYYPDQKYVLEGAHVIMVQDGIETLVSSKEDLLKWEDGLKVEYYKVAKENSSISSTETETVSIPWGGREHFPENGKWENAESVRINFETQYKSAWESYLRKKKKDIGDYVENG